MRTDVTVLLYQLLLPFHSSDLQLLKRCTILISQSLCQSRRGTFCSLLHWHKIFFKVLMHDTWRIAATNFHFFMTYMRNNKFGIYSNLHIHILVSPTTRLSEVTASASFRMAAQSFSATLFFFFFFLMHLAFLENLTYFAARMYVRL